MNYEKMDNELLIAELDDLVQFKIAKKSNTEWVKQTPEMVAFRKITKEIYRRMEVAKNGNKETT